jgi:hypothetical protein
MTTATARSEDRGRTSEVSTEEIKQRLSMVELLQRDNVDLRRMGPNLVALCPFHSEKTASFTIFAGKGQCGSHHGHCFGCGWHGDIFTYWKDRRGCEFKDAVRELAGMVGLELGAGRSEIGQAKKKVSAVPLQASKQKQKPALPVMRQLNEKETADYADLRGLSLAGMKLVADRRHIGFSMWPLWPDYHGGWCQPCSKHFFSCSLKDSDCSLIPKFPSIVITDDDRRVASFRRLDGKPYEWIDRESGNCREIKAWTKGSPSWPLGVGGTEFTKNILLVEGGPDLLAAFHFMCAPFQLKNGRLLPLPDFMPV